MAGETNVEWLSGHRQASRAKRRSKYALRAPTGYAIAPDNWVADVIRLKEDGLGTQAQAALQLGQALPVA